MLFSLPVHVVQYNRPHHYAGTHQERTETQRNAALLHSIAVSHARTQARTHARTHAHAHTHHFSTNSASSPLFFPRACYCVLVLQILKDCPLHPPTPQPPLPRPNLQLDHLPPRQGKTVSVCNRISADTTDPSRTTSCQAQSKVTICNISSATTDPSSTISCQDQRILTTTDPSRTISCQDHRILTTTDPSSTISCQDRRAGHNGQKDRQYNRSDPARIWRQL